MPIFQPANEDHGTRPSLTYSRCPVRNGSQFQSAHISIADMSRRTIPFRLRRIRGQLSSTPQCLCHLLSSYRHLPFSRQKQKGSGVFQPEPWCVLCVVYYVSVPVSFHPNKVFLPRTFSVLFPRRTSFPSVFQTFSP